MRNSDFQLDSQRILKTEFELNPGFKIPKDFPINLSGKTEVKQLSDANAIVVFNFSVFGAEPLEKVPFKISVSIEGIFSWNDSIDKIHLRNYLNYNAPSVLLSYVRSVVSMITAYAGLPKVMIPLINFYEPPVPIKKEGEVSFNNDEENDVSRKA